MKWEGKPYQIDAVKQIIEKKRAMPWYKPGDGKTSMTLAAFAELKKQGLANKALLIAPLRVARTTWPDELAKWDDFNHLRYAVLYGENRELLLKKDVDIYIINYEGLKWLLSAKKHKVSTYSNRTKMTANTDIILKMGIDTLIIDELSKCKNGNTNQTRLIYLVSKAVKRCIGLTGTPAANSLLDVFWETKCVDLGASLGTSIMAYREKYFYQEPYRKYSWKLKKGAEQEIYRRLANVVIQRSQDIRPYDMPTLSYQSIYVDLPKDVKEKYEVFKRKFVADFKGGLITAKNVATKMLKLRQIASGGAYVYDESAQEDAISAFLETGIPPTKSIVRNTLIFHTEKAKALVDLVDKLNGQPLLVFYSFEHDIECIRQELGDVIVLNKEKDTDGIIKHWNEGSIPVMLLHPRAGAHGLNLQMSGGNVCWFTCEWSHEMHEQGNRRVWRQGNPAIDTRVYYLLARDTIDDYVLGAVQTKAINENNLIKGVEKYVKSIDN